eukprot:1159649-Pelagomonas_calceolata.AAC.14
MSSIANRKRQPHQLNANQRHVNLIEIKYCEDTRPGQQLEAAQRQHADLCKLISAKTVTLHTIPLGVTRTCYIEQTLDQFKQLGLDHQLAIKLACKLHAHSVMYANKFVRKRKSYASGQHLKRCIKEGPTPTATRARTRDPPLPGRGRVLTRLRILTHRSPIHPSGLLA